MRYEHEDFLIILGVSANPDRMSHQALHRAHAAGISIIGVHPDALVLAGAAEMPLPLPLVPTLEAAALHIKKQGRSAHTLSVYVRESIAMGLIDAMVALAPKRIILNPGADTAPVAEALRERHQNVMEACTLVLLSTGQY